MLSAQLTVEFQKNVIPPATRLDIIHAFEDVVAAYRYEDKIQHTYNFEMDDDGRDGIASATFLLGGENAEDVPDQETVAALLSRAADLLGFEVRKNHAPDYCFRVVPWIRPA